MAEEKGSKLDHLKAQNDSDIAEANAKIARHEKAIADLHAVIDELSEVQLQLKKK